MPPKRPTPLWATDPLVLLRGDQLLAAWPTAEMSSDAKLNSVVRLSVYVTLVLLLCKASYLVLYLPLVALLVTYGMHAMAARQAAAAKGEGDAATASAVADDPVEGFSLFDDAVATGQHPNAPDALQHEFPPSQYHRVNASATPATPTPRRAHELAATDGSRRKCTASTKENPFMNVLVPDIKYHPTKPAACTRREQGDVRARVEANFDARTFRDVGDVWAHAGGQRQFFTMPWTTTPNDPAGDFGQWLYDVPPTKKEQGLMLKPLRRPNGLL